ncbi:crosslink repair DNA glycosylase YcaQ family protein [Allobranchiibius sp. GilTou73]|uniref:DNA glycosylase AlkZ-like family protein n=1 Tax=unclassified Allobranchiibius TaxID=2649857 RepID=UPI001AA1C038|nr:crosslink repair DNA glycosylase YcaQ family protein [Allobranchiibius sp. GilTou73]MBO1767354.1 winged helix DNA-binding domain-containing protein [Allobranchiibius sp. GilTou38]UIJ35644.1 winged helix DNA-binding domain-containing protein [Allobranchiibius sp. GilTou73]
MASSWAAALGWRLRRHHLIADPAGSVEDVVGRLVAVPAWLGDASTAIRLRVGDSEKGDVDAAIAAGRVVCVYAFRGATHLMTPDNAAVHMSVRGAGRQWELASWRTFYGLEPGDWPRLRAAVREALSDGPLSQHELAQAVAKDPAHRHLRQAFEDRSHTFLKPFCWQGDLCFAPSRDGAATFRSFDSIPTWRGLGDLDDAGPSAIRAYLAAYGPATRDHIDHWLAQGLSAGRRRLARWIEDMADELTELVIDGDAALCLTEHAADIVSATPTRDVVLLPGYDQWVMGAGTSDTHVVPPKHRVLATRGANTVLIGGRFSGTWERAGDTVRVRWLDGESAGATASLRKAAQSLSAVLGSRLRVQTL